MNHTVRRHSVLFFCLRFSACICVYITTTAVMADDNLSSVPFVPGFDRFGRHADIDEVTAGRLLITELSCTACHKTDDATLNPKRGPVLDGAGSRLRPDWIRSFLRSPATAKHGTAMPDMLATVPAEHRESTADAISAFLSSLEQPFPEIKATGLNPVPMEFWNRGNAENGRRLYHQIGCVACHEPDSEYEVTAVKSSPLDDLLEQLDADELKEMGLSSAARKVNSVPHSKLPAKYTHQSLTYFLLNPEHTRANGRMPNFSLLAVDAADIAAWLLRDAAQSIPLQSGLPKSDAELIAKGRQLFSDLHCASCHVIQGTGATAFAKPLAELDSESKLACWTEGAVSKTVPIRTGLESRPTAVQPRWAIDSAQATAIKVAIASSKDPAAATSRDELSFRLLQQNCYACHDRNQLGGIGRYRKPYFETVGHIDIGDEGRLPPALTHVGNRLNTSWLNNVLTGKGSVRPYMTIRMPVFPADITKPLPAMFAKADAAAAKSPDASNVFTRADTKSLIEAGRQLMDTGCVQCHVFKGESLPGVVGIDLEGVTNRVQPAWLHDFLKDPGSLKERTRMPTFFPNGQSQNRDVLNGDVELQLAAMSAYLKEIGNQPLPDKIQHARDQNYELTPTDRPIVLRTFMPITGTHAIAVGFPQHVHFAFDAENISLSQAWRGRFLDAEGTWFVRFAPPADPLGDRRITFPPRIAVAELDDNTSPWPTDATSAGAKFRGYRLDNSGVPTFLYSVHGVDVEDRIEPDQGSGLRRTIAIQPISDLKTTRQLWLRANAGMNLTKKSKQTYLNETGLIVTVEQPNNSGELRTLTEQTEWIIAFPVEKHVSIKLRYESE